MNDYLRHLLFALADVGRMADIEREDLEEAYRAELRRSEAMDTVLTRLERDAPDGGPTLEEFWTEADQTAAGALLRGETGSTLREVIWSLDYTLELRANPLSPDRYPRLWAFLIAVSRRDAIDRENHGHGYHFHHVSLRSGRRQRTNVFLTFDPKEPTPPDTLYWEHHAEGHTVNASPANWGRDRCRAIHSSAVSSLQRISKIQFRPPSGAARPLYRQAS